MGPMEPTIQHQCNEFYIRGTKFRVFPKERIITVYNQNNFSRKEVNACIRYMILEAIIEMDTYQVNVYS